MPTIDNEVPETEEEEMEQESGDGDNSSDDDSDGSADSSDIGNVYCFSESSLILLLFLDILQILTSTLYCQKSVLTT